MVYDEGLLVLRVRLKASLAATVRADCTQRVSYSLFLGGPVRCVLRIDMPCSRLEQRSVSSTTEANLGDGLFSLAPYLTAGGAIGIGSDSNASISPVEELRWLEYGQRLATRRRIVAATAAGESCGETLHGSAARGGATACGFRAGALEPGRRADIIVLDDRISPLSGAPPGELLDRYVFATDRAAPSHVMMRGR